MAISGPHVRSPIAFPSSIPPNTIDTARARMLAGTCFEANAPAGQMPWGGWDAAAPYTGVWEPMHTNMFSGFAENGHAIETAEGARRVEAWAPLHRKR